jgi:hypothetical protein
MPVPHRNKDETEIVGTYTEQETKVVRTERREEWETRHA